jgi:hypothetical protein
MPLPTPIDDDALIDILNANGWELVGWGHAGAPWEFRREETSCQIVAPTVIAAIRRRLVQECEIDPDVTSDSTP